MLFTQFGSQLSSTPPSEQRHLSPLPQMGFSERRETLLDICSTHLDLICQYMQQAGNPNSLAFNEKNEMNSTSG